MSATTNARFRVKVYGLVVSGSDLTSGYLRINFDNYRTWKTSTSKDLRWPDESEFQYETRHADRLARKKVSVELVRPRTFGSDTVEGSVDINLYNVATGSVQHRLALRDGGSVRGRLCINIEFEEQGDVEVALNDVEVDGIEDASDLYVEYAFTGAADGGARRVRSKEVGVTHWAYLDLLYFRASAWLLLNNGIHLWFRRRVRMAADEVVDEADIDFEDLHSFEDNTPVTFEVPLSRTRGGTVSGRFFFVGVPGWSQMVGGYQDETGIHHARLVAPDLPHLPTIPMGDEATRQVEQYRARREGRGGHEGHARRGGGHGHGHGHGHGGGHGGGGGGEESEAERVGRLKDMAKARDEARAEAEAEAERKIHEAEVKLTAERQAFAERERRMRQEEEARREREREEQRRRDREREAQLEEQRQAVRKREREMEAERERMRQQERQREREREAEKERLAEERKARERAEAEAARERARSRSYAGGAAGGKGDEEPPSAGRRGGASGSAGGSGDGSDSEDARSVASQEEGLDRLRGEACWERCVDPASGRTYFKNHVGRYTVWELPTEPYYTERFSKAGSLGLQIRPRVVAATVRGPMVQGCSPGGRAEASPLIYPGLLLVGVSGVDVSRKSLPDTMKVLSEAGRPCTLRFRRTDRGHEGQEHTVTIGPGTIGMQLAPAATKMDRGAIVSGIVRGSQAEEHHKVQPGHVISKVNGKTVEAAATSAILLELGNAKRPVDIEFFNPGAVK